MIYYVAKNGSDSVGDGSQGNPWLTVQKAADTIVAGDTVRVQSGLYDERVAPANAGTSGAKITYFADGAARVRGFNVTTKHFIRMVGFEITHQDNTGAYNYNAITTSNCSGVEILDNWIHHTDVLGIRLGAYPPGAIIRGNVFEYIGWPEYPALDTVAGAIVGSFGQPSTGTIVEYNYISYVSDYINPHGEAWIMRNNYFGPTNTGTVGHVDGFQPNNASKNNLIEANFHENNYSADNHFYLNQQSGKNQWIIRGNLSVLSNGAMDWQRANAHFFYHNTFAKNFSGAFWDNNFQVQIHTNSTGNVARNNIWYKSVNQTAGSKIYAPSDTSVVDQDYEIWFQIGAQTQTNGISGDPGFTNVEGSGFDLTSSSIAINAAGPITVATSNGTDSTSLPVANSMVFWSGDSITINGNAPNKINAIDFYTNTLTLNTAISWTSGSGVFWRGQRDIGALPYFSYGYSVLGNLYGADRTYTVLVPNTNLVRFVVFYEDGIPLSTVESPPFTYTSNGGTVTARIYPLYASRTLWEHARKTHLGSMFSEC